MAILMQSGCVLQFNKRFAPQMCPQKRRAVCPIKGGGLGDDQTLLMPMQAWRNHLVDVQLAR